MDFIHKNRLVGDQTLRLGGRPVGVIRGSAKKIKRRTRRGGRSPKSQKSQFVIPLSHFVDFITFCDTCKLQ